MVPIVFLVALAGVIPVVSCQDALTTDAPVSFAPQTAVQTGDIQTAYPSIDGLTTHSQTTTVISGTTTVLPVWHCGPTETASACKECPPTPEGQTASCNDGFNALVLLPLVLAPGYFLPPPVGLPTLTVGPGGPKTYEPPKPTEPPKETQESEKSTEESTFSDPEPTASCVLPMFKASDKAMPKITTSSLGGIPTPPPTWKPDTSKNPLPILPFQEEGAIGACGGGGSLGRYFTSGFHQFGDTFSRTDGLNAIKEFCALHARNGSLLGPDGFKIFNKNAPQNPANHIYEGTFNTKSSGKITVRAIYDWENRIPDQPDCIGNGPDGGTMLINLGNKFEKNCNIWAGQTVEHCQPAQPNEQKDSNDVSWKKGGTFYYRCGIWEVFKTGEGSRPLPWPPADFDPDGRR